MANAQEDDRPLAGLLVIELAGFLAGPFTGTLMAEFGARVVKVEPPQGDPLRRFGTGTEDPDRSLLWLSEARNKTCLTLDLDRPEGVALLKRLLAKADVVIDDAPAGRLTAAGLDWPAFRQAFPQAVLVQASGYGAAGPCRDRPGAGLLAQAFGGLSALAGFPGGPPMVPGTPLMADYTTGLYGFVGAMIALEHRARSGRGQRVDLALYEPVLRQLDEAAVVFGRLGKVRQPEGSGTVTACPHGHFQTRDGKWVAIACTSDKMFARLAGEAMGRPELAGPDLYGPQARRLAARDTVVRLVADWTATLDREALLQVCVAAGVPIGPINSIADIFADPHFRARADLTTITDPQLGPVTVPSVFPKLSRSPGRIDHLGPPRADDAAAAIIRSYGAMDSRDDG
ncbi:MAG: CoA transferase [Alphaproteobacteria bacterium]|nr:CoA transferase [Alphaproteobacteria bacterium]